MSKFKLGRIRPTTRPKMMLSKYLNLAALPTPPDNVDYSAAASNSLSHVYLNDQYGDCVIAAGGHLRGVTSSNAGNEVIFTDSQIQNMYSQFCGFVPGRPGTD